MKAHLRACIGIFSLSCIALPTHAAIIANFTDGTGTTFVDQFAGKVGNGWTSAWGNSGSNIPATTVTNATPINGSDNYLTVSANGTSDGSIGRAFDGTGLNGGVDATQAVTYSFDLRVDSLAGWDTVNDYLTIHSSTGTGAYNVSSASSFIIRAYGASPSAGKNGSEWLLYNGAGDGGAFAAGNFQNSGMSITAGTTYHFTITNYAATKKYDVAIFDGTNTVSSTGLGWRATNAALQTTIAFNNKENSTADAFGYSIDNIAVVPEPSAVAALLGGIGMLAGFGRRRRLA